MSGRSRTILRYSLISLAIVFGLTVDSIIVVNAMIDLSTAPYIYKNISDAPKAEVVVIPGAAILADGGLSSIFKDRVDMAIKLYEAGKVSKILVSGDNSTVSHNEVNPVLNYLLASGIPDQDIFLDHAGFDTYSTMYRAKAIFEVTSMLVSSQAFHLPRAVFIANELGIPAYGVDADVGATPIMNYVREVFADEKVVLDLLDNRVPEYLGAPFPITGNGSSTQE